MSNNLNLSALPEKAVNRFFAKIEKTDHCWHWLGAKSPQGYGKLKVEGKIFSAHRISFYLKSSKDPGRQRIQHTCGDKGCVNPDHLKLAANLEAYTRSNRSAEKPVEGFPLTAHPSGRWCKKILGKLHYFGPIDDWQSAIDSYESQKIELHSGRKPKIKDHICTVDYLRNHFLTDREQLVVSGELKQRTFRDYQTVSRLIVKHFGPDRDVTEISVEDFADFRSWLANGISTTTLGNRIRMIRMVFVHAYEFDLVESPVKFGRRFREPDKKAKNRHRRQRGKLLFTAAEIRAMLIAANPVMRSWIYLGLNAGLGNADIGCLEKSSIDFDRKWLDYPRTKNEQPRECPLWDETIAAIREAVSLRPAPVSRELDDLVFLTSEGNSWYRDAKVNPISRAFTKVTKELGMHKKGRSFYTLRRCCETIGGEIGDQASVDFIMGHADSTMAGIYRQEVNQDRLRRVVGHIRGWLLEDEKSTLTCKVDD